MRRGSKEVWQPEMDPILTHMWMEGNTAIVIAKALTIRFGVEITEHVVRNHRFQLDLPSHSRGGRKYTKPTAPVDHWTQDQLDILYREWPKGTQARIIGFMAGKTYNQVLTKRAYCKLPPRQGAGQSRGVRTNDAQLHVWMDHATRDKLAKAATTIGVSASRYIRLLLERDLRTGSHAPRSQPDLRVA